jgi:deoxycitidine kinase/deoxyguanosine kinase
MSSSSKFVYIEGIIGAGKSTFISNISSQLSNTKPIPEPVEEWVESGVLNRFYKDMSRWAFSFQLRIIHDKVNHLNSIYRNENIIDPLVYIVERSMYSDACFSNTLHKTGVLDTYEYNLSNDVRKVYENRLLVVPSLIIYIRPPIHTCMERVLHRNRCEEIDITSEYQQALMDSHDDIFLNQDLINQVTGTKIPILVLDDSNVTPDVIDAISKILES